MPYIWPYAPEVSHAPVTLTNLRLRSALLAILLGCQVAATHVTLAQNRPIIGDATAFQSHNEVAASLIAQCLLAVSPPSQAFAVSRPNALMTADPAVLGALRDSDRSITLIPWGNDEAGIPILRYQLDGAAVKLAKGAKRRIHRAVSVRIAYTTMSTDRTVLDASFCERSHEDDISRKLAAEWSESTAGIPLSIAALPGDGLFKRLIRPAVAVAATSVSLYLLFSLRSERKNDSQ